jgi:RNA polymerase sigma-70 factor, ECF subfamily
MAAASSQDAAAVFDPLRPALIRAAYRMLGSVADAEDVVQDAFLRWLDVDRNTVREPAAFLRRVVTRLCLDRLKSVGASVKRTLALGCPNQLLNQAKKSRTTLLCRC